MSQDPYCYPGTDVLRNNFHIHAAEELKAAEARVAAMALFAFMDEPLQGPVDEDRFKATHRAIFQHIYDWAGIYRENTGTMTKARATGYPVTYGNSQFVPVEMKRIFQELAAENYLCGFAPDTFAERLAYFYAEIDATHPFREGNSRTLRQFSADLALVAGYELDWRSTARSEASINALYTARDLAFTERQYRPLIAIVRANLFPLHS